MKKLIVIFALMLSVCVNAQIYGGRGRICVTRVSHNRVMVDRQREPRENQYRERAYCEPSTPTFDRVEQRTIGEENILVEENVQRNYYHTQKVVENHYYLNQPVRVSESVIINEPVRYEQQPYYGNYEPAEQFTNRQGKSWGFFYRIDETYPFSSVGGNRNEFSDLINFYRQHPDAVFYIDSYGDKEHGTYQANEIVARGRADAMIEAMTYNGIPRSRIFAATHGCRQQVYNSSELNRCVIIKSAFSPVDYR